MQNWIGVAVWIALGIAIGLGMSVITKKVDVRPGHRVIIACFGAFGALVGGMLGVGFFEFEDPAALSVGGLAGAIFLSALLTWVYRWGSRALI